MNLSTGKSIVYLLSVITCLSLGSCGTKSVPTDFDYGKVENNQYTNSFFGLSMSIPPAWAVQSKEQTDLLVAKGQDLVAGDNENMKSALKASEVNTAYLLSVFKHEPGSPVDFNPAFMISAENLKNAPGIKNGSDYLFQTKKLLEQSQIKYSHVDDTFNPQQIGGKEFHIMKTEIEMMGKTIKQDYYVTVANGFALAFILSYDNDESKAELNKIVETTAFEKE